MKQLSPSPEAAAAALGVPVEQVREMLGRRLINQRHQFQSSSSLLRTPRKSVRPQAVRR